MNCAVQLTGCRSLLLRTQEHDPSVVFLCGIKRFQGAEELRHTVLHSEGSKQAGDRARLTCMDSNVQVNGPIPAVSHIHFHQDLSPNLSVQR